MVVMDTPTRVYTQQINEGLKSPNSLVYVNIIRALVSNHLKAGGAVFLGADLDEKATQKTSELVDYLAASNNQDMMVAFDAPCELGMTLAENAHKSRQEIRSIFPPFTNYKVAALQQCAKYKIPTFSFGWSLHSENRYPNPWALGPMTLNAIWNRDKNSLRRKWEHLSKTLERKSLLVVVDAWSAADIGMRGKFNEPEKKRVKSQGDLFEKQEFSYPSMSVMNVKVGTASLAGHEPWREACYDWIIRTE